MTIIALVAAFGFGAWAGWAFRGESDRINAHMAATLAEIDRERGL